MKKKIKVLVVDNSAVMRQILTGLLDRYPSITVLCVVADSSANPVKKYHGPCYD